MERISDCSLLVRSTTFASSRSHRQILDVDVFLRCSRTSSIELAEDHRLFFSSLSLSAALLLREGVDFEDSGGVLGLDHLVVFSNLQQWR
ncbi:hypothetical protein QYF36_003391 [Acer negundo]|nr:hypothetical protein QYF36_003391 [Acer negundo]